MHLIASRPGGYARGDEIVDLGQQPGELVLLSAADTDVSALAAACEDLPAAFPRVRVANLLHLTAHGSVDRYVDQVARHARVVVAAVLGGVGYWSYGVDRLAELAGDGVFELVLVPGDDTPDPELTRASTAPPDDCARVWRYLRAGGPDNARALLAFVGARWFGLPLGYAEPRAVPRVFVRERAVGAPGRPVAAVIYYRAHVQAGNVAAFDALCDALDAAGLEPLPIAVASLKADDCRAEVDAVCRRRGARVIVNTTAFSIAEPGGAPDHRVPVLQAITSGGNADDWRAGTAGLAPRDLAMNVVLPEVDGRIITRAISFKERVRRSGRAEVDVVGYRIDRERAAFVAELAARWAALADTPAAQRRVALVLANYPTRDGRLGNGVGLDTPASTLAILRAMAGAGYTVGALPADGDALLGLVRAHVTNDVAGAAVRPCQQSLAVDDYAAFLAQLPAPVTGAVRDRWGPPERDPMARDGRLMVSGVRFGNAFVGVQPARGYHLDLAASYHDPALIPPHGYLAFYAWVRRALRAHVVVHVGKHGNLEWLPGKSVALGPECWPDVALGPMPHLYPFIVNDPGEGTQAKRRAQAVIVDHLVPPLTRAETYGALRELEQLMDEYAAARELDPPRAAVVRDRIVELARAERLDRELPDGALLSALDTYLCELKESQIRDGLHVLGSSPAGEQRLDTLAALARWPVGDGRGADRGLIRALSDALLGGGFDPMTAELGAPWTGPRPALLAAACADPWRTAGDTRERLELIARRLVAGELPPPPGCADVVARVLERVAPALDACGARELEGLLAGLAGEHVPPGPSGAPTRGRLDALPTGRNFYSVDVRAVPTRAAWALGARAATALVRRYTQDHGDYPRCIALSVWGTSTMRTGGDDVAQALALLGARPVWCPDTGRVTDVELVPANLLGRPRVDVVLRISGLFRDAFPELIRLIDAAVRAIAELDEPAELNPLRAQVARDEAALIEDGAAPEDARRRARWRVFGSKPGAYGAGLQGLIDGRNWRERGDLARAYLAWSSFAYGRDAHGSGAGDDLRARLGCVQAVVHNQDNREHDILDSDDYYQFHGGLAAAVEAARGTEVALYHGDHANPEAPRVRALREELARVIRSRVVNPKWIAGARRHGYKGAAEMAATVDYLFAFGATTSAVRDDQYERVADAYLLDPDNRAFLARHNPDALREMAERLVEAMQRGLWREPGAHRGALEELLIDAEELG